MVTLSIGLATLLLLAFALRLVWLRTCPHFADAAELGAWMKTHDVERVVIRHGQLTVAERSAPAPEVPADVRTDESTKHIDDEINEALGVFAREQKRGHA